MSRRPAVHGSPAVVGALLAVALLAGTLAMGASAAAPAWDVSGRWTSFIGDLQLSQAGDGGLSGSFQMKTGCTEAYAATGRIDGVAVSLSLARANGGGDQPPCAGTQTLKGSVGAGGTTLNLALANFAQTSPLTPFSGRARDLRAQSTTTAPPTWVKSYPVYVECGTGKQLCPNAYAVTVRPPPGLVAVRFTNSTGHCSDVRVRIALDGGSERISPFLGPGKSTSDYSFHGGSGPHRVRVRAEGRPGGCNHGDLRKWAGTLRLWSTP